MQCIIKQSFLYVMSDGRLWGRGVPWARAAGNVTMAPCPGPFYAALREAGRWLAGSQSSRLRQRATLRDLDDRLLADVGISREEARRGHPLQPARPRGERAPER
jgi:uncharacterized protein YjiS (DUF1127 family)